MAKSKRVDQVAGQIQMILGQLIQQEIVRINANIAQDRELAGAQIRRFLILNKELDADDGEITRTRKLRRGVIAERYARLIEALYSDAEVVESKIEVTYEDGRTGVIENDVGIRNLVPAHAAV